MDCPKRSALAGLPDETMLEILARVPARSVYRSKCVAKAWRDLINDPLNRNKLPQTLEGFFFVDKPDSVGGGGDMGHLGFINVLARSVPLDIDPRFSFLRKIPGIESLYFSDSCNGLLLFEHCQKSDMFDVLGYIVCNPATKHWVTVPTCGSCPPTTDYLQWFTFLAFDPAVSSHFHLIQLCKEGWDDEGPAVDQEFVMSVHAYSSETGMWSHNQTDWDVQGQLEGWHHHHQLRLDWVMPHHVYVNGTMHFISYQDQDQIIAVDAQGKTKRIITVPAAAEGRSWQFNGYIGQSQGCLHYINNDFDAHDPKESYELSIWVLKDYDTQEWVLKDTVSFLKLFERMSCAGGRLDFSVVAIHQDCNVVYFLQPLNRLIAYDMDRKKVSVIATFENENWDGRIAPYIPYLSESPTLTNKH